MQFNIFFITVAESGKEGGILKGKAHSECDDNGCGIKAVVDGTKTVELERDELIINRKAAKDPEVITVKGTKKQIASAINSDKGYGVEFAEGAEIEKTGATEINSSGEVANTSDKFLYGGKVSSDKTIYIDDSLYSWRYNRVALYALYKSDIACELEYLIDHPYLFEKYKGIGQVKVWFFNSKENRGETTIPVTADLSKKFGECVINIYLNFDYYYETGNEFKTIESDEPDLARESILLHEIQHILQALHNRPAGISYTEARKIADARVNTLRANRIAKLITDEENKQLDFYDSLSQDLLYSYFYYKDKGELEARKTVRVWLKEKGIRYVDPLTEEFGIPVLDEKPQKNSITDDNFGEGGVISADDKKDIHKRWKELVNMSASELQKFYDSKEGKDAGLSSSDAKSQGIDYGRESARWILKMKETPVSDWTDTMWRWAKKQISFISRMSANKGDLYNENGIKTRKHTSLLIWGHNPKKNESFEDGGELEDLENSNEKPIFTKSITKKDIDHVISGESKDSNEKLIKSAISYIKSIKRTSEEGRDEKSIKQEEAEQLKRFAIEKGILMPEYYLPINTYVSEGAEQKVYALDSEYIIKLNDAIFYASWVDYLNNLLLHNYFFPDTAYELTDFALISGILYAVVKQRIVLEDKETDLASVEKEMLQNGFIKKKNNDYYNPDLGIIIEDLHEGNVLTKNGILYYIDTVFYLKEKFKHGGEATSNKETKMSDKIKGGLADKKTIEQIAKEQGVEISFGKEELDKGIKVEMEHTSDVKIAQEIALDHLSEDIEYYIKLEKVESKKEPKTLEQSIQDSEASFERQMADMEERETLTNEYSMLAFGKPFESRFAGRYSDERIVLNEIFTKSPEEIKKMIEKVKLKNIPYSQAIEIPKAGAQEMRQDHLNAQAAQIIASMNGLRPEALYNWSNKFGIKLQDFGHILTRPENNSKILDDVMADKYESLKPVLENKIDPIEPVEEKTGKSIDPHKEVSASLKSAIQDVISVEKYRDLSEKEAVLLYDLFKEYEILSKDEDDYKIEEYDLHEGDKDYKLIQSLSDLGYVYYFKYLDEVVTNQKAIDFINAVRARLETRKNVKAGVDLFPETANIPEFMAKGIYKDIKSCLVEDGDDQNDYLVEGTVIYNKEKTDPEKWVVLEFYQNGLVLKYMPKSILTDAKADKKISFTELKQLFQDGLIQIEGISDLKTLNLCIKAIKKCIAVIDMEDYRESLLSRTAELESIHAIKEREFESKKAELEAESKSKDPKHFQEVEGIAVGEDYNHDLYGMVRVIDIVENLGDKKNKIPYMVEYETDWGKAGEVASGIESQGIIGFKTSISKENQLNQLVGKFVHEYTIGNSDPVISQVESVSVDDPKELNRNIILKVEDSEIRVPLSKLDQLLKGMEIETTDDTAIVVTSNVRVDEVEENSADYQELSDVIENLEGLVSDVKGKEKKELLATIETLKGLLEETPKAPQKQLVYLEEPVIDSYKYNEPTITWAKGLYEVVKEDDKSYVIKKEWSDAEKSKFGLASSDNYGFVKLSKKRFKKEKFEHGGEIKNNYEGKSPEEVWNSWTIEQRKHFFQDHVGESYPTTSSFEGWSELLPAEQELISEHVLHVQYEKGGEIKGDVGSLQYKYSIINKASDDKLSDKDIDDLLNAIVESGLTDDDLKPKSTKSGTAKTNADDKKADEILAKIKPNYKGELRGNQPLAPILKMVQNNEWGIVEQFKKYKSNDGNPSHFDSTKQKMKDKTQQERIDALIEFVGQSNWSSKPITVKDNMVIVFSRMYDLEPDRVAAIFNKYQKPYDTKYKDGGEVRRKVTTLFISQENPLSSQLFRLTGDHYNVIDFEAEDGGEARAGEDMVFRHKKSGRLFKAMNQSELDKKGLSVPKFLFQDIVRLIHEPDSNKNNEYLVVGYENYNENYGWETIIRNNEGEITVFENALEKTEPSTTYKIEKIPNENYYGIYATNDDFADGFGSKTMLVSSKHMTPQDAQQKIREFIWEQKYELGGEINDKKRSREALNWWRSNLSINEQNELLTRHDPYFNKMESHKVGSTHNKSLYPKEDLILEIWEKEVAKGKPLADYHRQQADIWAEELHTPTQRSKGMSMNEIDEQQAHHERQYQLSTGTHPSQNKKANTFELGGEIEAGMQPVAELK